MKNCTQKSIGLLAILFIITLSSKAQTLPNGCPDTTPFVNIADSISAMYITCANERYVLENDLSSCQNSLGITQSNMDYWINRLVEAEAQISSLEDELNLIIPEDGISQADVDAAYAAGAASVTPEDGISQADVDSAYATGAASVSPEDGISQADVDAATPLSINMPIDLPQGWSILGYTCIESSDVVDALADVVDDVLLVKDEMGLSYIPDWNFNAIGDFEYGEGYQIKLLDSIEYLSFCSILVTKVLGCTDHTAFNFDVASNIDDGSCLSLIGCTDNTANNYNYVALTDDGSCDYSGKCVDSYSCNYSADADFVSVEHQLIFCDYSCLNCSSETACNFDENAEITSSLYDNICQSYAEGYGEEFECTDEIVFQQLQYNQPYQTFEQAIFTYAQNNFEGPALSQIYNEVMELNVYDAISFVQCVEPNIIFDNDCDCSLSYSFTNGWFNCNNTSIYNHGSGAYSGATLNYPSGYDNGILKFSGVGNVFNVYVSEEMSTFSVDGSGVDNVVNVYYSSNTNVINSMSGVNNVVNFIEQ